jgi:hypothetical protein
VDNVSISTADDSIEISIGVLGSTVILEVCRDCSGSTEEMELEIDID